MGKKITGVAISNFSYGTALIMFDDGSDTYLGGAGAYDDNPSEFTSIHDIVARYPEEEWEVLYEAPKPYTPPAEDTLVTGADLHRLDAEGYDFKAIVNWKHPEQHNLKGSIRTNRHLWSVTESGITYLLVKVSKKS